MKRLIGLFAVVSLMSGAAVAYAQKAGPSGGYPDALVKTAAKQKAQDKVDLPEKFDPKRDAAKDIATAVKLAKKQNKRVLIDVGGDWCIWCHRLDDTMKGNKEIVGYVKANYIVVKVNFSEENKNEEVLSKYPKITGYPHLFVLDSTGKLIKSEDTSLLEEGDHHDPKKIMAFLREWALKKTDKKVTDKKKTDKVGG